MAQRPILLRVSNWKSTNFRWQKNVIFQLVTELRFATSYITIQQSSWHLKAAQILF